MPNRCALRPGQHAVITGGSSGLGLALATALAQRKLDVTLMARDRDRLDQARDHIAGVTPGARIDLYPVDVSDSGAVREVFDDIAVSGRPIDVVINSAGIVHEGYFETTKPADFQRVIDIDFYGVVNVTSACLPYLKSARGHLVNVSSMAGMVGVFGETAYCAAKYAVNGFSAALRQEMEPVGITVSVVCPGEFATPLVEDLNTYRSPENDALVHAFPVMTVDEVAREVLNGIDRGDPIIIPGRTMRLTWLMQRIAPRLVAGLMRRKIAALYVGPTQAA
jgi:3-dehydrosphinganine reductase